MKRNFHVIYSFELKNMHKIVARPSHMTQIILRLELEPDACGDKTSGPVEEAAAEAGEAQTARESCPF